MSDIESEQLTIDELAQRTGLTTRNIRAYQSRGLIPPPIKRGRTGYYGPEHIERLDLIRDLREQGLALDLIQRIVELSGGAIASWSFTRSVLSQYSDDTAHEIEIYTLAELAEQWNSVEFELIDIAERAGVLRMRSDGRVEVVDKRLIDVGKVLLELGMPAREMLETLLDLREKMNTIGRRMRDIFNEYVWDPFERECMPEDRWDEITRDLERLRPLADEVTLALYRQAVEKVINEELNVKLARISQSQKQA